MCHCRTTTSWTARGKRTEAVTPVVQRIHWMEVILCSAVPPAQHTQAVHGTALHFLEVRGTYMRPQCGIGSSERPRDTEHLLDQAKPKCPGSGWLCSLPAPPRPDLSWRRVRSDSIAHGLRVRCCIWECQTRWTRSAPGQKGSSGLKVQCLLCLTQVRLMFLLSVLTLLDWIISPWIPSLCAPSFPPKQYPYLGASFK